MLYHPTVFRESEGNVWQIKDLATRCSGSMRDQFVNQLSSLQENEA